jgi:hypothetical protein
MAAFASSAGAQTCAAPSTWFPNAGGTPPLTGTTCAPGNETGIISVCQGAAGAPAAAYVVQINIADPGIFTDIGFTGGAGYTISAYLVPQANGCNADGACTTVGDGSTHMLHADIPPGIYYLIITGADFDASGACGTFSAAANGFLPVSLQAFAID